MSKKTALSPNSVARAKAALMWAGVIFVWSLLLLLAATSYELWSLPEPSRQTELLKLVEALFAWDVITGAVAVGFGAKFHDAIEQRLYGYFPRARTEGSANDR